MNRVTPPPTTGPGQSTRLPSERGLGAIQETALRGLSQAPPLTLFRRLASSPKGLTEAEATQRSSEPTDRTGRDTVRGTVNPLREAVSSPFVVLLAALGGVLAAVGDSRSAGTVSVMVAAAVGLRGWQQLRSDRAMRVLRSRVSTTSTVRRRAALGRPGIEREIPLEDVVLGDIVALRPGDVVPADMRVLTAQSLRVDQSVLSGELLAVRKSAPSTNSMPVRRAALRRNHRTSPEVVDLPTVCFAGTSVVSGSGTGVAIATGGGSYFGLLASEARRPRPSSDVDRGVRSVGWTLIRFTLVLVPIVLAVSGVVSGDWTRAVLYAVAVAVGLTPEMLPVIVAATLARGAVRLADRDVLVKRLDAISDLGGMDVLCLDKTGTLTEDRVVFTHGVDLDGRPDPEVARHAFLAVHFQAAPRDRLDQAVVDHVGIDVALLTDALFTLVDEIPFDHDRRRATTVVRHRLDGDLLITRGDPDEVLALCTRVRRDGAVVELGPAQRRLARDCADGHQAHGMRVLAVAIAGAPPPPGRSYLPEDEAGLVLLGFVGFVDPVKASAPAAVRELTEHGVAIRVLTGDSPRTAERVCAQAGIAVGRVVLGQQVETADDAALRSLVESVTVFAKVNPRHKARIVAALRDGGHCVGFLGDGVNDTTALRTADVGICVDSATPAARDAADMILLDADLRVIVGGVQAGRHTLGNTMKYVKITAASNLGNVFSVLAAAVLLPFLPMLPIQLMVQNLLYDAAQLALPWDRVAPEYLRWPRRWDARDLTRFMLVFGPLSSVFDLCTFACLWWVLGVDTPAEHAVFQSAWFVEGLLSQLLVVLVLRGRRLSRPSTPLLAAIATTAGIGLALPLSILAGPFRMVMPPVAFLPWLMVIVAAYLLAAQLAKVVYIRRTGSWI